MGTTSEKLTYLNTTKRKIKDSINNLGGSIDSNTTFRDYATQLDSIYSRLPKITGTGSNITLTPTLKGRLGSVLNGDTYQQTYSGKNLFHNILIATATEHTGVMVTPNSDGSITLNGTATANTYINLDNYNYGVAIGTLSEVSTTRKNASNNGYTISCYIDNGTLSTVAYDNGNKFTYIRLKSGQTYNNSKVYLQIEASSSMTDYEPYTGGQASPNPDYPQDIQCVEGIQNITIDDGNGNSQTQEVNLGDIKLYNGDYITGTPDNWSIVRNNGVIDSYNGETITTDYISTTGGLDTGATIVYKLSTPTTTPITDTYLISQLNALYNAKSYNDTTNISVDGNLPMILDVSALKGAE